MASPFKYTNKLHGARVLVIGSSSGIGFCVAEAALEHGASVVISSSNQSKLDKALARLHDHAKAIGVSPDTVTAKTCDLGNLETLEDNVVQLLDYATKSGKLDHVAYTAGDALVAPNLADITLEQVQRIATVRNYGVVMVAKHLPKYVNPGRRSSFTLTGGSSAWRPAKSFAAIAGNGAAIEGLARGFASALRPLRCNCVQPGAVHTEMFEEIPKDRVESILNKLAKESVLNVMGSPEEVAEAYIYCMKDTFTTGGVIESNGGRLIGNSGDLQGL